MGRGAEVGVTVTEHIGPSCQSSVSFSTEKLTRPYVSVYVSHRPCLSQSGVTTLSWPQTGEFPESLMMPCSTTLSAAV